MKVLERHDEFAIEAATALRSEVWTWIYKLRAPDGAELGPFVPETPEIHHSAGTALTSALANAKLRIDGFGKKHPNS